MKRFGAVAVAMKCMRAGTIAFDFMLGSSVLFCFSDPRHSAAEAHRRTKSFMIILYVAVEGKF